MKVTDILVRDASLLAELQAGLYEAALGQRAPARAVEGDRSDTSEAPSGA